MTFTLATKITADSTGARQEIDRTTDGVEDLGKSIDKTGEQAANSNKRLSALIAAIEGSRAATLSSTSATTGLAATLNRMERQSLAAAAAESKRSAAAAQAASAAAAARARERQAAAAAAASMAQYQRRIDAAKSAARAFNSEMANVGQRLSRFSRQLLTFGGIASGVSFAAFATSTVQVTVEMERLERRFIAAYGSIQAANIEMEFASDLADRLGTDLIATASSYAKFSAAARGTRIEGQQTREVFEGVVTALSALGLSADDQNGALTALEQILSKGKVQAEELRGQIGERVPGAFQIAARAMGITTQELDKLLETGQLYADDFLPKFAAQLKREYGDVADAAKNSFDAQVNRLNTFRREFQSALGAEFVTFATAAFAEMNSEFSGDADDMRAEAQDLGRIVVAELQNIIISAAGVVDALTPAASAIVSIAALAVDGFNSLPPLLQEVGIVGALLFGFKGKIALAALTGVAGLIEQLREEGDRQDFREGRESLVLQGEDGIYRPATEEEFVAHRRRRRQSTNEANGGTLEGQTRDFIERTSARLEELRKLSEAALARAAAGRANLGSGSGNGDRGDGEGSSRQAAAAARAAAQAQREHASAVDRIQRAYTGLLPPLQRAIAEADRWRSDVLSGLDQTSAEYETYAAQVETIYRERLAAAYAEDEKNRDDWKSGAIRGLRQVAGESDNLGRTIERGVTRAFSGLEDALVSLGRKGGTSFRDMVDGILVDIQRLLIRQTITGPLAGALSSGLTAVFNGGLDGLFGSSSPDLAQPNALGGRVGGTGGFLSGVGNFFSSIFDGFFADGGSIAPGHFGVVGEAGPEIVTGPATITPMHRLGGQPNITINIQSDTGVEVSEPTVTRTPNGLELDLNIRKIEGALARRVRTGESTLGRALDTTRGLDRGRGAG